MPIVKLPACKNLKGSNLNVRAFFSLKLFQNSKFYSILKRLTFYLMIGILGFKFNVFSKSLKTLPNLIKKGLFIYNLGKKFDFNKELLLVVETLRFPLCKPRLLLLTLQNPLAFVYSFVRYLRALKLRLLSRQLLHL